MIDRDLFDIEERVASNRLRKWFGYEGEAIHPSADPFAQVAMSCPQDPMESRSSSMSPQPRISDPAQAEASVDDVLLQILETEVGLHLETIEAWIDGFTQKPVVITDGVLRAFHTINGAFAIADVPEITNVTLAAEQYVKRLWYTQCIPDDGAVYQLRNSADAMRIAIGSLRSVPQRVPKFTLLTAALLELCDRLPTISHELAAADYHSQNLSVECMAELSVHDLSAYFGHDVEGPPPWLIGFSKQFKKDTSGLDRKLMGRILEVLEEVADYAPPFSPRGDTFKPLVGELAGCWRYRLGDHRLVLQPLPARSQINVLTFAARGSVYE